MLELLFGHVGECACWGAKCIAVLCAGVVVWACVPAWGAECIDLL